MNQKEKFDQTFDDCLDRLFKGQSVEQILADYPDQAKELESLLRTAAATRAFSKIQPRADFKSRARYEFMATARDLETRSQKRSFFNWLWRPAWAIGLASVLGVVMIGGGTVAASTNSMPGQALYSVKLAAEQVHLAFTFSDVSKTQLNAEFANRRSQEIEYLATAGDTEQIQMATARLNSSLSNMSALALDDNTVSVTSGESSQNLKSDAASVPPDNSARPMMVAPTVDGNLGQPSPTKGTGAVNTNAITLPSPKSLAPVVPPVTTPPPSMEPAPQMAAVPQSTSTTGRSASSNNTLSASGVSNSNLGGQSNNLSANNSKTRSKKDKMRKIIEDNYQTRKATLEAALEKASPDLKPSIRQAIADSENEYLKALQNLEQGLYQNTNQNSNQNINPKNNQTSDQENSGQK